MCDLLDALASTGIRMPAAGGMPECVWHNPNRRAALPFSEAADISIPCKQQLTISNASCEGCQSKH